MTNPTSNFGWQMPEPTDLVTNLPADFEVFGQAVDSDFADLLGGTTGQVLSKTSATDLDFTWVAANPGDITAVTVTSPITGGGSSGSVNVAIQDGTTAQKGAVQLENSTSSTSTTTASVPAAVKTSYDLAAAAIPKSTVTTNGDLIYGTGSAAVTRLGIGSAAQVLTVAGGVPTWATTSAGSTAGLVLITTSSFSGASSHSVNNCFSSTYDNYLFKFNNCTTSTNNYIGMRMRVGGVDYTATDYRRQAFEGSGSTGSFARTINLTSFTYVVWIDSTYQNASQFELTNPFNTKITSGYQIAAAVSAGNIEGYSNWWGLNTATSYDGFTLVLASGTMTGSVSVYGYAK
jgi:Phage tail fibre repeat